MKDDSLLASLRIPSKRERVSEDSPTEGVARSGSGRETSYLWLVAFLSSGMLIIEYYGAWYSNSVSLSIIVSQSSSQIILITAAIIIDRKKSYWVDDGIMKLSLIKTRALIEFGASIALLIVSVPMSYQALANLWAPVESDIVKPICILCIGICVDLSLAFVLMRSYFAERINLKFGYTLQRENISGMGDIRLSLFHAIVKNQLIDVQISTALLFAMAISDLFGWTFMEAIGGIIGAFILCVAASKSMIKAGTVLVDSTLTLEF